METQVDSHSLPNSSESQVKSSLSSDSLIFRPTKHRITPIILPDDDNDCDNDNDDDNENITIPTIEDTKQRIKIIKRSRRKRRRRNNRNRWGTSEKLC